MQLFKNKLVLGGISIVLALLIGFVVAPLLMRNAAEATVKVVRVKEYVPAESEITEDMLQIVQIGGYGLPDSVMQDTDTVIGKYAAVDLQPEDNLTDKKIKDSSSDLSLQALDGENIAVSIALDDLASSVSGRLHDGDIVTVYAVLQDQTTMQSSVKSYSELQYMKVLALCNSNGVETDKIAEDASASEAVPATVTLLAKDFQARRLIEIQSAGSIHMTLVGSDAAAQKLYADFEPQNPYNKLDGNPMINLAWGEYLALPGTQD